MIKRLKIIFFIIECLLHNLFAQAQNFDSIRALIDKQPRKALLLAQKIEKNAQQDSSRADALSIQGNALLQINDKKDFERAVEKHQKAWTLRRQVFGNQSLQAAYSLVNLGNAYWENKKQDSIALFYYQQAINIFEVVPNDDKFLIGNTQRIIADIYLLRGDFKTAQKMAEKAVFALHTEGGAWLFAARLVLGKSLYYNDKIAEAFHVLQQAEALKTDIDGNEPALYAALADCLDVENTSITNHLQAFIFYQKALNTMLPSAESGERSKYFNKMGVHYLALNKPEKALFCFKKALNDLPKHGFEGLRGTYLTQMGNAYRLNKQFSEARQKYMEALRKLDVFPVEKLGALTELAQTEFDQALQNGHWFEALEAYKKAIQYLESHENQLASPQSALILRGYFHSLFGGATEVCIRLGKAEEALFWAERGKAFLLKKQRQTQEAISLQTIQNQLLTNNRLLIYSFGRQSLTVFVVTQTAFYPLSIDTTGIADAVKKVFECIRVKPQTGSPFFHEEAYFLYQKLVEQTGLQPHEDLIIVPDGLLHYLPFETLLSEKPKAPTRFNQYAYLIKNHCISYCLSAIGFPQNREKNSKIRPKILAFAPIYDPQKQGFDPLQHNEREVNLISTIFKSKIYKANAATKNAFIREAPEYGLIHISTHGIPNRDYPEKGFLVFATEGSDNGIFAMAEMDSLKLAADLVVLSACETADGKYYGGEGLMSMAHAFMSAGAKNIVGSLWQVNDSLTTDLMAFFYQNLKNGETVESALQKAKIMFADGEKARIAHPYYWAAFVFSRRDSANTRFTDEAFSSNKWVVFFSFLAIIAVFVYLYCHFGQNLRKG